MSNRKIDCAGDGDDAEAQGTTPRKLTDLIGSLLDLTSAAAIRAHRSYTSKDISIILPIEIDST